jgi:hypothetical protein
VQKVKASSINSGMNEINPTYNELDTHADTCCFGGNVFVLSHDLSQHAMVEGFHPELGSVRTPIVSVAVAYDDATTYTTYILVFHQVLYFENLQRNLICPAQLRMNDILVNDVPLEMLRRSIPMESINASDHSIISNTAHSFELAWNNKLFYNEDADTYQD